MGVVPVTFAHPFTMCYSASGAGTPLGALPASLHVRQHSESSSFPPPALPGLAPSYSLLLGSSHADSSASGRLHSTSSTTAHGSRRAVTASRSGNLSGTPYTAPPTLPPRLAEVLPAAGGHTPSAPTPDLVSDYGHPPRDESDEWLPRVRPTIVQLGAGVRNAGPAPVLARQWTGNSDQAHQFADRRPWQESGTDIDSPFAQETVSGALRGSEVLPGSGVTREHQLAMLDCIMAVQAAYIDAQPPASLFAPLLQQACTTAGCSFGFLGEAFLRRAPLASQSEHVLEPHAIAVSGGASPPSTATLQLLARPSLQSASLDTMHGPSRDLPSLSNFLCIPLACAGHMVGVLCLGGRPTRFSEAFHDAIAPLSTTAAALLQGFKNRRVEQGLRRRLTSEKQLLDVRVKEATAELRAAQARLQAKNAELVAKHRTLASAKASQQSMFGKLTHEVKNPLYGMKGHVAELVEDAAAPGTNLTPDQAASLAIIQSNMTQISLVVEDILALIKMQTHAMRIRPTFVSMRGMGDMLMAAYSPDARNRGRTLTLELSDSVPPLVLADKQRLRQVLDNYVYNAIKYASKHVKLTISSSSVFKAADVASWRRHARQSSHGSTVSQSGVGADDLDTFVVMSSPQPGSPTVSDTASPAQATDSGMDASKHSEFQGWDAPPLSARDVLRMGQKCALSHDLGPTVVAAGDTADAAQTGLDAEYTFLLVQVADDGRGLSPEVAAQLFKPFVQEGDLAGGQVSEAGTGLGLAIVHELAIALKGEAWVVSQPGQGSAFRFLLPVRLPMEQDCPQGQSLLQVSAAAATAGMAMAAPRPHCVLPPRRKATALPQHAPAPPASPLADLKPTASARAILATGMCTVLVVDDADVNRRLHVRWLKKMGAPSSSVVQCTNGVSAVEIIWQGWVTSLPHAAERAGVDMTSLREYHERNSLPWLTKPVDIVVCDMSMAPGNGYAVMRELHRLFGSLLLHCMSETDAARAMARPVFLGRDPSIESEGLKELAALPRPLPGFHDVPGWSRVPPPPPPRARSTTSPSSDTNDATGESPRSDVHFQEQIPAGPGWHRAASELPHAAAAESAPASDMSWEAATGCLQHEASAKLFPGEGVAHFPTSTAEALLALGAPYFIASTGNADDAGRCLHTLGMQAFLNKDLGGGRQKFEWALDEAARWWLAHTDLRQRVLQELESDAPLGAATSIQSIVGTLLD